MRRSSLPVALGICLRPFAVEKKRSQQEATARGASRVAPLFLLPSSRNFLDFLASQTRGLHQDGEKDTRPLSHFRPLAALLFTDRRPPAAHSFADTTGGRPIITYHSLLIFNAPNLLESIHCIPPKSIRANAFKREIFNQVPPVGLGIHVTREMYSNRFLPKSIRAADSSEDCRPTFFIGSVHGRN